MEQNKRIKKVESACTNCKTCYNTPMTAEQESRRAFLESILENPSTYSNEEVGEFLLELEKLKWEHSLTR